MLAELRADVAGELEAGDVKAYDYTADSPRPPCAVVVPSPSYLVKGTDDDGFVFGEYGVGLDVLLLVARDVNKKNAARMDALIEQALGVLLSNNRDVVRVARPDVVTLGGIKYLGAFITIADTWEAPRNGS